MLRVTHTCALLKARNPVLLQLKPFYLKQTFLNKLPEKNIRIAEN